MTLALVKNTHTATVAGVRPGEEGKVEEWVARGPLSAYLQRLSPPLPRRVAPKACDEGCDVMHDHAGTPPVPEAPPAPEVEEVDAEDLNARQAREVIRHAGSFEDLERWLDDPRKSVSDAAKAKARALTGLD